MSDDEPAVLRRRLITVPAYVVAWLLWMAAAPIWIPVAIVVDAARRSGGVALRCVALVAVYLSCEIIGLIACAVLPAWRRIFRIDAERWHDVHFRLQAWWGTTLFRAVVRLFGLRLEVDDQANLGDGPYLMLVRHVSTADTLLACAFVSRPYDMRLRYVLKRELLWDPCLDIVGNRLPNVFLDRDAEDSTGEVDRLQALARGLGPRDGVLIYPEGTRFSQRKRERILDRLRRSEKLEMLRFAESLRFVLPPRPAGTLALLETALEADVVVCAHTGFEGAASLTEIWRGALLKRSIRIQYRRIPREEVPKQQDERVPWLLDQWRRVDAWVERNQPDGASASP